MSELTLAFALHRIDVPMPLVVTCYSAHLIDGDYDEDNGNGDNCD